MESLCGVLGFLLLAAGLPLQAAKQGRAHMCGGQWTSL
uniref:Glycoprotein (transmembrane) nmb n=1 Tax=Mus musculus TaxID=10090 RepID=A0A0N4SVG5_MOUSE